MPDSLCNTDQTLSSDGRYALFLSTDKSLVPGDTNGGDDVFVRDRTAGTTTRVSVSTTGEQTSDSNYVPVLSADERFVAWETGWTDGGLPEVYIRNLAAGTTRMVSVGLTSGPGNGASDTPSISANGRYVAFESEATNLTPDGGNGYQQVYLRDRTAGTTTRASVGSDGTTGTAWSGLPEISADGRYVVFSSLATNLVPGDTNHQSDLFLHDMQTGTTERVSVSTSGHQANSFSQGASISADGRYVAYISWASNLVKNDTNGVPDVFVRDRALGTTVRASVSSSGVQGDDTTYFVSLSADGRLVLFSSKASNLVADDTNGVSDAFLRDMTTGKVRRVSVSSSGTQGNDFSMSCGISADGHYVSFDSLASNLVRHDTNGDRDVFVRGPLS
jgi:Tol biopolymer transport system component